MTSSIQKEIKPLTALRGFAAIWVAAYHFMLNSKAVLPGGATGFVAASLFPGTFGVDIFFVLSGFVISYIYRDRFAGRLDMAETGKFLLKRFARIYPAYAAILTVLAVITWAGQTHPSLVRHSENFPMHTLAAQYLLIQSWGIVDGRGWILPAWSVSAEFFAYLLFPLLTVAFANNRKRLGLAALSVVCFLYVLAPYDQAYGYPALIRVMAEFGIGVMLHECLASRWIQWTSRDASLGIILAFSVIFLLALPLGIPRGLFFVPAALIVAGLATNRGYFSRLLSRPPLEYLGRISYSLYVWHSLALPIAGRLAQSSPWLTDRIGLMPVFGVIYLVVAGVGAVLTYHLVEKPARRWILGEAHLRRGIPRPS